MNEQTFLLNVSRNKYIPFIVKHIAISGDNATSINCQVCNAVITLDDKLKKLVLKCHNCGEATPIKEAPSGGQYIRCSCNCLLYCKPFLTRVRCPRQNCLTIISLSEVCLTEGRPVLSSSGLPVTDGNTFVLQRSPLCVNCGNCSQLFYIFSPSLTSIASNACFSRVLRFLLARRVHNSEYLTSIRCPHCRKINSVGPLYSRVRWVGYLLLTFLFFLIAVLTTAATVSKASTNNALYFLWAVLYLITGISAVRSLVFLLMPVSLFELPEVTV